MSYFPKPAAGDVLRRPSARHTRAVAETLERAAQTFSSQRRPPPPPLTFDRIHVVNAVGEDLSQGDVVGIGDPLTTPSDDLDAFRHLPVFSGDVPADGGRFAILITPLPTAEIGRALICGVTTTQVTGEGSYATISEGVLTGTDTPTDCVVLYRAAGTGPQWAIVRLTGGNDPDPTPDCPPTWVLSAHGGILGGSAIFQLTIDGTTEPIEIPYNASALAVRDLVAAHSKYGTAGTPTILGYAFGPLPDRAVHLQWSDEIDPPVFDNSGVDGDDGSGLRSDVFGCGGSGGQSAFNASEILAALETADPAAIQASLGLADAAFTGDYSDLAGTPTLGTSAPLNVGTTAGTVCAGDDTRLNAQTAADVAVTPSGNLSATTTQAALLELQGDVDAKTTLSGVAATATHLGTFTGSTIADSATIKSALQALETALETKGSGNVSDGGTLTSGLTFPLAGLKLQDTDGSHPLTVSAGSNLTAARTLTITTGDADRTLNLSAGSVTITAAGNALTSAADAAAQKATLSVDDLVTLSGVADGATHLGTFTGDTIADSSSIKAALQALETAVENASPALDAGAEVIVGSDGGGAYTSVSSSTWTELQHITLPDAGTYLVFFRLRGQIRISAGTSAWVRVKLVQYAGPTDVPHTETRLAFTDQLNTTREGNAMIVGLVTTTGSDQIAIYALRDGTGSPTFSTSLIATGATGYTVGHYLKIA